MRLGAPTVADATTLPPVAAIAAEPQIDLAARHVHAPVDDGQIVLLAALDAIARCSAAWTAAVFATTTIPDVSLSSRPTSDGRCAGRPLARVPEQRVHHRAGGVLVGRVHDDAGGLVEREQVIVFVEDVER